MNRSFIAALATLGSAAAMQADIVAHFPMEVRSGQIVESVSGQRFGVEGNFPAENVAGAVGKALRFDGYTSHVNASLGNILASDNKQMTLSLWVAVPCYPIIEIDTPTTEQTPIVSCMDTDAKTGFGFFIGYDGKYSFRTYVGGWPVEVNVSTPLSPYEWHHLAAVVDCEARTVKVYDNGVETGAGRASGSISFPGGKFYMGQGTQSRMSGPFELMSFNGLIDDVVIYNEALGADRLKAVAENAPDLDIPASRFEHDLLRPRFHGMPAAGWTNECHGMWHDGERFHLFFQKNADGPYMARLHWGHITSSNLCDWTEEPIAIAPGNPYDIKGCWSGCVFADDEITSGEPNILYTGVDYARASIDRAVPADQSLNVWEKVESNPIIAGRPDGLSDDFRDPYFFRSDAGAFIIVGSSKNGAGTTTLHRYNESTRNWESSGLFFTADNPSQQGSFWEMPNVTRMPDGKWLFTVTPLGGMQGVRTLYWLGSINSNGCFEPDAAYASPKTVELNSKEGFGLLSPTVYRYGEKTLALGIVPDKLPSMTNWRLGWAHCYSLPREWSIGADGTLVQKPFEGLTSMRSNYSFSQGNFQLSGTLDLAPVQGRAAEISAVFEVGNSPFGFNIFKGASGQATLTYTPAAGELTVDFSNLPRYINDEGVYNGVYHLTLPERPSHGSEVKINVFIDHSILDIFINDRYATSIRVFPTQEDANGIEAFAQSSVNVKSLEAWVLDASDISSGGNELKISDNTLTDVFSIEGIRLMSNVSETEALNSLPAGLYIINGKKHLVK